MRWGEIYDWVVKLNWISEGLGHEKKRLHADDNVNVKDESLNNSEKKKKASSIAEPRR